MKFLRADILAGVTVAMVAIPQGMAYAELAGLPAHLGLLATAAPALAAAAFASSAWIQVGPVATTSLLTLGALSAIATPGSEGYVALAVVLALLVGLFRLTLGLARLGRVNYVVSRGVMQGFIFGAGVLIAASQVPSFFGLRAGEQSLWEACFTALSSPERWSAPSVAVALATIAFILVGRRIHRLFPSVLVAGAVATAAVAAGWLTVDTVGEVPALVLPNLNSLPWGRVSELLLPALVIAVLGFTEAASLGRAFSRREGTPWSADRELISQGVANLTAGLCGTFPVGASFSRTALNHLAGARTRLAGGVTGVAILAFLPLSSLVADLPRAVLAGTLLVAVSALFDRRQMLELWRDSRPDALVALIVFTLTLALAPHVERAVLLGMVVSALVRAISRPPCEAAVTQSADELNLVVRGHLWLRSVSSVTTPLSRCQSSSVKRVVVQLGEVGSVSPLALTRCLKAIRALESEGRQVHWRGADDEVALWLRALRLRAASADERDVQRSNP